MHKRNYIISKSTVSKSRIKKIMIAVIIIFVLYRLDIAIFGEMGIIKYSRMNAHYTDLTEEVAKLKQDNARLTREVHALKTDTDYIERIARDKLGLARPGETVYYYDNRE